MPRPASPCSTPVRPIRDDHQRDRHDDEQRAYSPSSPNASAPIAVSRDRSLSSPFSRLAELDQGTEQHRALFVAQTGLDDQAAELDLFARVLLAGFGRDADFAMRSNLASAARSRASCDRRWLGPVPGRRCRPASSSGWHLSSPSRNRPGHLLEGRLELRLVDLDLTETGLEGDPADALGLARFGLLQLLLEAWRFLRGSSTMVSSFRMDPLMRFGVLRRIENPGDRRSRSTHRNASRRRPTPSEMIPAVPKERSKGAIIRRWRDTLLLHPHQGAGPGGAAAAPDEPDHVRSTGSRSALAIPHFSPQHRRPWLRPQRGPVGGLPALREDGRTSGKARVIDYTRQARAPA